MIPIMTCAPSHPDRILHRIALSAFAILAVLTGLLVPADGPAFAGEKGDRLPVWGYRVLKTHPHDRMAYTQGLLWLDGFLYESTGQYGASGLRKVRLETGQVLERHDLDGTYYGEGLATWGGRLYQLTWTQQTGFIYDRDGLRPVGTFRYPGEGWGLAQDGKRLIMSDGTAELRFMDPVTLKETGRLKVRAGGVPVGELNELEVVRGEILANIYRTDRIARISPKSGAVTGWIDLTGLLPQADRWIPVDVLNGIAYDAARDRLFVTGKLWPKLFEIELIRRR